MLTSPGRQSLLSVALTLLLALNGPLCCAASSTATSGAAAGGTAPPGSSVPKTATAPNPVVAPAPASSPTPPPAPAPAVAPPMTGPQIIQVLDQTIDWYRTLGIQQQAATEPSDLLILYDNRQTANHVIALAFDIARANAEILAKQPEKAKGGDAQGASQTLAQLQDKFTAQGAKVQAELESDQRELKEARAKRKTELQAKVSELQGELDLIIARKSLLATLSTFTNQNGSVGFSSDALKAQIDAMAVTLPASTNASAATSGAASAGSTAGAGASSAIGSAAAAPGSLNALTGPSGILAARFGLWDLGANVVRLSEKITTIDLVDRRTQDLQATFATIRTPLIDQLKALSARGDALATQADTADSTTLNQVRDQLDALSAQFKQYSALLIPLSKQGVLLDQFRRNIGNWRDAVTSQYKNALETLGVRCGVLAVLLAIVFAAAELWRRAVLRYVQDARRRYQLLLVRRIALWSLVLVIIGFAFASELGSIVTFAGLITAGLAVAMQSVLVSIVGYFFLIGKYGIRIGDRVQIGEVTGEVIEVGLVRLYLMELGGHGTLPPTGRVVAFANSIVFSVSSGLFKQLHGVNLVWHETVITLPEGVDVVDAKKRLTAAVNDALKDYREEIVRQSQEIQRTTVSESGGDIQPRVQLNYSAAGVEAHIRYPVHSQHAAEIDERVSLELSKVQRALAPTAAVPHPP
jgi:small-conductance mechanosensitive channel